MIRFRGTVELVGDPTPIEFEAGNAAMAAWERYAVRNKLPLGKESPPIISSLVIAHHALARDESIEAFIEKVDGIELEAIGADGTPITAGDAGAAEVPPTPPAPITE